MKKRGLCDYVTLGAVASMPTLFTCEGCDSLVVSGGAGVVAA